MSAVCNFVQLLHVEHCRLYS